jgi:N-acetylglucosaminyldiphosphoundecaprenol N-acetyl-beta-D-mannosaminyltransferase
MGFFVAYSGAREPHGDASKRPSLWGVNADNFSVDYALGRVGSWISAHDAPRMIITPDALAALRSRTDARYAKIARAADMALPDGTGFVWALRFLGFTIRERIAGVDFVDHLCKLTSSNGWPVYFFGGRPGIAQKTAEVMAEKYPGLRVAGCRSGYFKPEDSPEIVREIRESGARVLLVALGVPRQEYWLQENLKEIGSVVGMGVGGSFDVISGDLKRAPERWRRMRLEWLYRTIQEPSRWRRVVKLPLFVILVLMKKFGMDRWRPSF